MVYAALLILTIVLAGLMVGNELTVAVFLHPTLRRMPDNLYAPARRSFAALFGRAMPFWYVAVFLLTAAVTWIGPPLSTVDGKLLLASLILWLLAIVYTLIFPAPLNSKIAHWQLQSLPADWKAQGVRWDHYHALRMVMLVAALTCSVVAAVVPGASGVAP